MEQLALPGADAAAGSYVPWEGVAADGPARRHGARWRRCSACRRNRAAPGMEVCAPCNALRAAVFLRLEHGVPEDGAGPGAAVTPPRAPQGQPPTLPPG